MIQAALVLIGLVLGSGLTIQIFVFPPLISRIQDRSAVSRVSGDILRKHHTLAILLLLPVCILFILAKHWIPFAISAVLLTLNLYQRIWIVTRIHLVKQPIGVQDLIQPDNVLREEFNRLQNRLYLIFRIHLLLLLIDLIVGVFV